MTGLKATVCASTETIDPIVSLPDGDKQLMGVAYFWGWLTFWSELAAKQ